MLITLKGNTKVKKIIVYDVTEIISEKLWETILY